VTGRALHATLLDTLPGGERGISYVSLERAERDGLCPSSRLPFTLRILAESALRHAADPASLDLSGLDRRPRAGIIEFHPARLLLQDFTGVPLMTDLASLRDAVAEKGGDPLRVNPRVPIDFVLDHALIAVHGGHADARALNERIEIERNRERFAFLKWCAQAFDNIRLLPPGAGIMHQLNLEYLSSVVRVEPWENGLLAMPDTVMGTDSHTTMVSGLGVLGLGVGGIEAEGAMLGHPTLLSRPRVVGLRLEGELPPGTIATDLVLHVAERLRKRGVTGTFIEACGSGIDKMPVETRATIANMAPEYGAAGVYFPIDDMTLRYLRLTGRDEALIRRVETYAKCQMLWRYPAVPVDPSIYDEVIEFDLSSVEPSLAGPNRPEQRVSLSGVRGSFERVFGARADQAPAATPAGHSLADGDVVIAAITSCTNTANPSAMLAAGLLARNVARLGLKVKPWVKTSFAPGSLVVREYMRDVGLQDGLDALGFQIIGFGCTTCNGNSGPLAPGLEDDIVAHGIQGVAVLSGNRNFEGRIHPLVRAAYLASPALVIAYALTGTVLCDLTRDPIGVDATGRGIMLSEVWPSDAEVAALSSVVSAEKYRGVYRSGQLGHSGWQDVQGAAGARYPWQSDDTFFAPLPSEELTRGAVTENSIDGIRALAVFGDGITTDHLSPNGPIRPQGPAADYLAARGVKPEDFGTYSARRGNHAIAVRGTFANAHLLNEMVDGARGGITTLWPEGRRCSIFEASSTYAARGTPTIVIAGRAFGSGSSRDWAAKGQRYLGVRAVLAESFERIHRSNLVNMGILPLLFPPGAGRKSLALTGRETFALRSLAEGIALGGTLLLDVHREAGSMDTIEVGIDLETEREQHLLHAGGLLPVLLSELVGGSSAEIARRHQA
jgi:aconitate hydratase